MPRIQRRFLIPAVSVLLSLARRHLSELGSGMCSYGRWSMRFVQSLAGKRLLLLLAVVALVATPVVNAQGPVTRPFRISGEISGLDIFGPPPWTVIDQGVASETGKYVSVGKYSEDFTGFGIYYAADGDQIFWRDDAEGGVIKFTGGTGRFAGATGQFTFSVISSDYVPGGPEGTWTWVLRYKGEGSITY
jgi:hypothetical protein